MRISILLVFVVAASMLAVMACPTEPEPEPTPVWTPEPPTPAKCDPAPCAVPVMAIPDFAYEIAPDDDADGIHDVTGTYAFYFVTAAALVCTESVDFTAQFDTTTAVDLPAPDPRAVDTVGVPVGFFFNTAEVAGTYTEDCTGKIAEPANTLWGAASAEFLMDLGIITEGIDPDALNSPFVPGSGTFGETYVAEIDPALVGWGIFWWGQDAADGWVAAADAVASAPWGAIVQDPNLTVGLTEQMHTISTIWGFNLQ